MTARERAVIAEVIATLRESDDPVLFEWAVSALENLIGKDAARERRAGNPF